MPTRSPLRFLAFAALLISPLVAAPLLAAPLDPGIPVAPLAPLPARDAEDRSPISPEDRQLLRTLWPDLPKAGPYQYFHWAPRWLDWLRRRPVDVPPAPSGVVFEGETNITSSPQAEAESFVAVDPDDPRFVLAAANDFNGPQGLYASTDGGATWRNQSMPRGGYGFHSDPGVGWDSAGNGYTVTLGIKGGTVKPIVSKTTDRGATWSTPVNLPSTTSTDKELLFVDSARTSPCRDFVYVAWDQPGSSMKLSRSTDGAASWSDAITLERRSGIATTLASGPEGELFVAWNGLDRTIRMVKSVDCGASFGAPTVLSPTNQAYDIGIPSFCRRRALLYPALDVDRSGGCRSGWVYAAWVDSTTSGGCSASGCPSTQPCTTDIFFSRSSDGGATWSPRKIAHEDLANADQFNPWLAVDPVDGSLWIAFQDTRNDPERVKADTYLVRSTDGGESFSPSMRLSGASTNETSAGSTTFQWGDYNGLAAAAGRIYAVWTDRRPGGTSENADDIFLAVVTADPQGCVTGDFGGGDPIPLN
jgi:hypothetical protein